jgi:hypothetical protein
MQAVNSNISTLKTYSNIGRPSIIYLCKKVFDDNKFVEDINYSN